MKNRNVIHAFLNAWDGLIALMSESAARRELAIVVFAIALLAFDINVYTIILFVLSMMLLALESLNTAIEDLCNCITRELDPRIKRIKDLGAASILLVATTFGVVLILYCVRILL